MPTTPSEIRYSAPPAVPPRTQVGQWWLNRPLRVKLLSVIVLAALMLLPPIVTGAAYYQRLTDARDRQDVSTQNVERLNALQGSLVAASTAIDQFAIVGFNEPEYAQTYRAVRADVPGQLDALEAGLPADLRGRGEEVRTTFDAAFAQLDGLAEFDVTFPQSDEPSDEAVATDRPEPLLDSLLETTRTRSTASEVATSLDTELRQRLSADRAEVDRLQGVMLWSTLISLVIALAVAGGGIYAVTSGIVGRIEQMSRNSELFPQGLPMQPVTKADDEIGRLNAGVDVAIEIIEDRRYEALAATRRAEDATKAKDDFLSRVSHELKTPLTAMIGFAQLLEEDPDLSTQSREDAARIVSAGHHLQELIEEMLDIKAIEAGKLALTIEPLAVREAVDDAVSLVQPRAADRSITIATHCPAGVVVAADRRRLREVLLNLLSNAVKYNHHGGHVDVTATPRTDDTIRISVTDTGPGITPHDQELLFRPFERLDAHSTDVEGTGIGLTLTKNVVHAMDGSIGLESTPGEGSTFWVDLPAARSATPPGADVPSAAAGTAHPPDR
jgi:signal transduction histidine kinase